MKILLIIIFILGCVGSFFAGVLLYANTRKPIALPLVVDSNKLFKLTNEWRTSQNLPTYKESELLCDQASIRAFDIDKEANHAKFKERWEGKYNVSENLTIGYTEEEAMRSWIDSPTHLDNLKADYKNSCIRCIKDKCVQLFANY